MQKSKICLPDVNVWIALSADRHVHHAAARRWFLTLERGGSVFCRVTQRGFLRLITNRRIMGDEVLNQQDAWEVYEKLARDKRVLFAAEPAEIESVWKRYSQGLFSGTNAWTDAYLAAFAAIHDLMLVSFDRGFQKLEGLNATILPPDR